MHKEWCFYCNNICYIIIIIITVINLSKLSKSVVMKTMKKLHAIKVDLKFIKAHAWLRLYA